MKRIAFLFAVLVAVAQQPQPPLANIMLVDGIQTYVTYGASFVLRMDANGVRTLEVVQPKPAIKVTGERLPWDNARLGWVLPPGTVDHLIVNFYGHRLRRKLAVEQDFGWDYEVAGDLVKPQRNPWPSTWHTYFDYELTPPSAQP